MLMRGLRSTYSSLLQRLAAQTCLSRSSQLARQAPLLLEPTDGSFFTRPLQYDVILGDVKHTELSGAISKLVGIQYLSGAAARDIRWPVKGIFFGEVI